GWKATNWISEANAIVYTGGDRKPKTPIFLVTGLRPWFGASGWALNLAARWNVAKFGYDNSECKITELSDCGISGLVGLTYAPLHLARIAQPRPAAPAPVPPPPAAPESISRESPSKDATHASRSATTTRRKVVSRTAEW